VASETDPSTDEGLRTTLRRLKRASGWDRPTGEDLLTEIRHGAARTAANIAAKTGVHDDRNLVDDVVASAWLVAVTHRGRSSPPSARGPTSCNPPGGTRSTRSEPSDCSPPGHGSGVRRRAMSTTRSEVAAPHGAISSRPRAGTGHAFPRDADFA